MPDWSYRTLFRPLLHRLSPRTARTFTLRSMAAVSRMPAGTFLIKTLGHMEPSSILESQIGSVRVTTPVGLGGAVDPGGIAHNALAQLGFGFLEIGPVEAAKGTDEPSIRMDHDRETIDYPNGPETIGLEEAVDQLRRRKHDRPVFVTIATDASDSSQAAAQHLAARMAQLSQAGAAGFSIECLSSRQLRTAHEALPFISRITLAVLEMENQSERKPLLLYIPADYPDDSLQELLANLDGSVWSGVVIRQPAGSGETGHALGPAGKEAGIAKVRLVRELAPAGFIIQIAAGIHEPQDALDAIRAGADHVLLNSGFVYAGPGLPKRVNDAILYERVQRTPEPEPPSFWKHWGWMCLLGTGMIVGGITAWLIALSTVLLPYDEAFLGTTRHSLHEANTRLLHFMSHDRITLAGTMISIGILYYQLAKHGLRHGIHWARMTLLTSCVIGFPSFFLYLGYGFFDPLHAAAAAVLLPMFLLSMRNNPDRPSRDPVNLRNDRTWRMAVWGQLCFVLLGVSLAVGGIVIAGVGVSHVFVPTDLAYLDAKTAQLESINPKLIPLIAHDRAGFGGALLSDAAALLTISLWGIQQGAKWLWKTLLFGGAPGFAAGISVHFRIGYTDFIHLLPAYAALFLYIAGLILLYPYLMNRPKAA
ncbi:hypothetical protein E5161_11615 [Cohnella pontilimi]|uniref:Dihydroorotate dehydrogenase catalytic domain-containing protein n=1 Tax=Cohnella pontilimi TaxID=2564100 RepID=A0A4U0FAL8_9BACL|nr:hypothetical protein [Cohnella pontilimi]TJY41843.1 hypothetical protein E5161_11615 [Cohnella pontilimi]